MITSKLTSDNHAHCDVTALTVVTSLLHDDTKQLTCPDNIAKNSSSSSNNDNNNNKRKTIGGPLGERVPYDSGQ